jgi:uncharacterized membrane protein YhiD involved in acid resistance
VTRQAALVVVLLAAAGTAAAAARQPVPPIPQQSGAHTESPAHWDWRQQLDSIRTAVVSLPIAAVLGAALAFRPRRRGTPERSAAVIQTQMILAVVGAIVMLVVGASLARAFGIVGAASLVRYRAKIEDPKDAGVMLSTLAVGLASGVGLYALAIVGTLFVLGVLWVIESLEPEQRKLFTLHIEAEQPKELQPNLEQLLRRHGIEFELRTTADDEISYEVRLPVTRRTDRLSNAIKALEAGKPTAVEWEEKKAKG